MKSLKQSSLALMALTVAGCATGDNRSLQTEARVIEFKSGSEGFDTRTFFYEGAHEVVAIDAQFTPELARKSIEHLRKYTQKPVTWLVITHPNPDKFNGANEFKNIGARIVASKSTADAIPGVHSYKEYFFVELAKMFKKGSYPQPTAVDQTFEKEMDLVLKGGDRLTLRELSAAGVSSTQTFVATSAGLFVGDLIHHKAHAWLEGGIVNGQARPSVDGWISDLRELASLYDDEQLVYGGRGQTTSLGEAVPAQIKYLETAVKLVRAHIRERGTSPDYAELSRAFAKRFPDYSLPYMIEYGAYGLVQAETAALK